MTLMLGQSRFAGRNLEAGSATEEIRDERHLMETVLVQIAGASKDILLHSSNGKGQI
jgi:hypothetical protein